MDSSVKWILYNSVQASWDAMYEACADAKSSICFEQYIMRADKVGKQFFALFERKAREGVRVRLVFDAVGSGELYLSNIPNQLRESGVEVYFFNPPQVKWRRWIDMLFPRDHSKILVVDDTTAFIGGVCMDERMCKWRDTHMKLEGEIVQGFSTHFAKLWDSLIAGERFIRRTERFDYGNYSLIFSKGHKRRNEYYRELVLAISKAEREIFLTTPYYVPRRHFTYLLKNAMARGVEVHLILSCHSNWPCLIAGRAAAGKILKHGAHVYMYGSCMIHSKTIVIDDKFAAVGSSNLDSLSFFMNREANILTKDKTLIEELQQHFMDDISKSDRLSYADWKTRPWKEKMLSAMLRPVRHLL